MFLVLCYSRALSVTDSSVFAMLLPSAAASSDPLQHIQSFSSDSTGRKRKVTTLWKTVQQCSCLQIDREKQSRHATVARISRSGSTCTSYSRYSDIAHKEQTGGEIIANRSPIQFTLHRLVKTVFRQKVNRSWFWASIFRNVA